MVPLTVVPVWLATVPLFRSTAVPGFAMFSESALVRRTEFCAFGASEPLPGPCGTAGNGDCWEPVNDE